MNYFSIYGGELFDRVISDDFILTEKACVAFIRQICEGLEYMHHKMIIHLDMKVSQYISGVCLSLYLPLCVCVCVCACVCVCRQGNAAELAPSSDLYVLPLKRRDLLDRG